MEPAVEVGKVVKALVDLVKQLQVLAAFSEVGFVTSVFCLIVVPLKRYDDPENLPSQLNQFCLIGADGGQATTCRHLLPCEGEQQ